MSDVRNKLYFDMSGTGFFLFFFFKFQMPPLINVFQAVTISFFIPASSAELITSHLLSVISFSAIRPLHFADMCCYQDFSLLISCLCRWYTFIQTAHVSVFLRHISLECICFPNKNESVELVSLSEHVIITSPEHGRGKWVVKLSIQGCRTAKCEIWNVFHLLGASVSDGFFWTAVSRCGQIRSCPTICLCMTHIVLSHGLLINCWAFNRRWENKWRVHFLYNLTWWLYWDCMK